MPGTGPEDVARAFRVAGDAIDLRKTGQFGGPLWGVVDREVQGHFMANSWPPHPVWSRRLSRAKGSRAASIEGKRPLVFSGRLRQSLGQPGRGGVLRVSVGEFAYGTNVHYATVQNDGGGADLKIDPSWLQTSKNGVRYARVNFGDGWRTIRSDTIRINIQPRPFMFLGAAAQEKVADVIGAKIERDFERA